MSLAPALEYKYPDQQGIRLVDGVIVDWPSQLGPIPRNAEIDTIIAEYNARDIKKEALDARLAGDDDLDALVNHLAARFGETTEQFKAKLKATRRDR